jgi:hypothetical protein
MGDAPFALARFGSTEYKAVLSQEMRNVPLLQKYRYFAMGWLPSIRDIQQIEEPAIHQIHFNAGVFPYKREMLKPFYEEFMHALSQVDLLAVWLDEDILKNYIDSKQTCSAECIEPYDYAQPWSRALAGKKVLVVHPFAETIEKQYQKRELLWENKDVLPEFELKTIKAVQTCAGETSQFKDWTEALDYMKRQIDATDFDIAIIGCGAYGFPLAAYCKQIGKKAIHMAGATQILFGIKGKRWDDMPAVNKFYNEQWVYPSAEETPKHKERVEGGCYW